jgi:hypothetical protein
MTIMSLRIRLRIRISLNKWGGDTNQRWMNTISSKDHPLETTTTKRGNKGTTIERGADLLRGANNPNTSMIVIRGK